MKNVWLALSICSAIAVLGILAVYLYSIYFQPVFVRAVCDETVDSKLPIAERIKLWQTALMQQEERIVDLKLTNVKAHMAEICNSSGFTIADEYRRRKLQRNHLLVAIWLYRKALAYSGEATVTDSSLQISKHALNSIKGLTLEYKITDDELKQIEEEGSPVL